MQKKTAAERRRVEGGAIYRRDRDLARTCAVNESDSLETRYEMGDARDGRGLVSRLLGPAEPPAHMGRRVETARLVEAAGARTVPSKNIAIVPSPFTRKASADRPSK